MKKINFHKTVEQEGVSCYLCAKPAKEEVHIVIVEVSDKQFYDLAEDAVASETVSFPLCTRHYNEWLEGKIYVTIDLEREGKKKQEENGENGKKKRRTRKASTSV